MLSIAACYRRASQPKPFQIASSLVPVAMSKQKRPRETAEAPVWLPRSTPGAVHNYVTKHRQKDKALEVVFDPKGHKCVPPPLPDIMLAFERVWVNLYMLHATVMAPASTPGPCSARRATHLAMPPPRMLLPPLPAAAAVAH
jgi:hypothetical protein